MKPAWKQIIPILILGLFLGAALGAWAHRAAGRHFRKDARSSERMLKKFDKHLRLDESQKDQLKLILESRRVEMNAFQQEARAKLCAIRAAMNIDIKKILKPEQQAEFDRMTDRWNSAHKPCAPKQ